MGTTATLAVIGVALALFGGLVAACVQNRTLWNGRVTAAWRWAVGTWKTLALGVVAAVAVLLGLYLIGFYPDVQVPAGLSDAELERRLATNEVRRTWIGAVGGAGALFALWLAWLRSRAALDTAKAALETAQATREGQITDRFTRAIEQLGAVKGAQPNVEVRIGGIYALEQIARDAPQKYHWQIMEVLCAYVRENHRFKQIPYDQEPPGPEHRSLHVQVALTVIGRRAPENNQGQRLDLSGTDLRGYDLGRARLEGADLSEAHMEGATLFETHLEEAYLTGAYLEKANLGDAHLERAVLFRARLEGADLSEAHLERAVLWMARLEEGDLVGAHLEEADLREAYLEQANLWMAHLERAKLDGARLEGANRPEDDLQEWGWKADATGRLRWVGKPKGDEEG